MYMRCLTVVSYAGTIAWSFSHTMQSMLMSYCVQPRSNCRSRESGDKLAGVEFIDENGGGPGGRLRNRPGPKQTKKVPRRLPHAARLTYRCVDEFFKIAQISIEAVTETHAQIARDAYRDFGKGSGHPAKLNFGDCFAYALAKSQREPLLFKGNDFTHTDITSISPT